MKPWLWLLAVLLAGCGQPKSKLNIFIWSEYIDPQIVADFEKQFDCKVSLDLYEDNESMMAKMAGGGTALYDIVVPSDYVMPAMIQRGLLAPLRHENIPNLKNIDPRFTNLPFDPNNQYSVPYQWGTDGLYIRKAKDRPIEETWGLVFDPKKQPGAFLLMDDIRLCFGAALKYRGHSVNSTDSKELIEARDLLLEAKKRSLGFESGIGGRNRVLAKGAVLAMALNGDATRGVKEDSETYYFVPREGSSMWLDNLCIPAKAPHRALAERFINFILDAHEGARLANFNQYASPNQAAFQFINPTDLKNPAIYPPPDLTRCLEFDRDLGEDTKLYDELWTQIKAR
jgi:spermidine/putrescine transport system substrate-binding protein